MQPSAEVHPQNNSTAVTLNRLVYRFSRHWFIWLGLLYGGFYIVLPFLAPVFMQVGLEPLGRVIYTIFSFLCHQLPERSFFLFGPHFMVPLADIQSAWKVTDNPLILRQFVGSPALGWKVAWSDRMVYMFGSLFIFGWVWWLLRKKLPRISWLVFLLFLIPMALDGGTHTISDILFGIHHGFRDSNTWLAALTQNAFAPAFYAGDGWGSI